MKRWFVTMGLAVAVAAVALAPAAAQAAAPASHRVQLTVVQQNGDSTSVVLDCDTDGGTHPLPKEACELLASVGGDIAAIPPGNGACQTIVLPVTAVAEGVWGDRKVRYQRTFSNSCVMRLATGPVFRF
ncbi:MAG TPA: SSI family serine proteinase inhibitor [Catenuloplanes sp.]|jgi:hypothetical protein